MKLFSVATWATALITLAGASPVDLDDLWIPSGPLGERAAAASLVQVTNFGDNPSRAKMYIYVPNNLAQKPAIVVASHYCSGTARAFYNGTPYARLADQKGFIVIYPESPYSGTCWDVSSRATLTHNGGGNSNAIANMVKYTISRYNADSQRVFAVGGSSGAMMTNVLAATYPDMFAAGIVYSGVPAGCFYSAYGGTAAWNSTCAQGNVHATPAQWANIVRNMYPGYNGPRPKMTIYHGAVDSTLRPSNYNETIKEWCGVFGFDPNRPESTRANTPQGGYTTYTWGGGKLIGVYASQRGHDIPIRGDDDMRFFGL